MGSKGGEKEGVLGVGFVLISIFSFDFRLEGRTTCFSRPAAVAVVSVIAFGLRLQSKGAALVSLK